MTKMSLGEAKRAYQNLSKSENPWETAQEIVKFLTPENVGQLFPNVASLAEAETRVWEQAVTTCIFHAIKYYESRQPGQAELDRDAIDLWLAVANAIRHDHLGLSPVGYEVLDKAAYDTHKDVKARVDARVRLDKEDLNIRGTLDEIKKILPKGSPPKKPDDPAPGKS